MTNKTVPHYSLRRSAFEPRPLLVVPQEAVAVEEHTGDCFFTEMPEELMTMIFDKIEPAEAIKLRIQNRWFSNCGSLRRIFIDHTFTEVCIALTKPRLDSLEDVLLVNDFAVQVRTLRIYSRVHASGSTDDAESLSEHLSDIMQRLPRLTTVTVVGEYFQEGQTALDDDMVRCNGLNYNLGVVFTALRKTTSPSIRKFELESISAKHRLHLEAIGMDFQLPQITDFSIVDCSEHSQSLYISQVGNFQSPALLINKFQHIATLSFNGCGHKTPGYEMAYMLNRLQMARLTTLKLSSSTFYENDFWSFCNHHQKTLEVIELKQMTLRGESFTALIMTTVGIDEDLNMSKLKTIRVNQLCETWRFNGDLEEEMHCAVYAKGDNEGDGMRTNYPGWWKNETLEIPGLAHDDYGEYYKNRADGSWRGPWVFEMVHPQKREEELIEVMREGNGSVHGHGDGREGGSRDAEEEEERQDAEGGADTHEEKDEETKDEEEEVEVGNAEDTGDDHRGDRSWSSDGSIDKVYPDPGCGKFHHLARSAPHAVWHRHSSDETWQWIEQGEGVPVQTGDLTTEHFVANDDYPGLADVLWEI